MSIIFSPVVLYSRTCNAAKMLFTGLHNLVQVDSTFSLTNCPSWIGSIYFARLAHNIGGRTSSDLIHIKCNGEDRQSVSYVHTV